MGFVARIHDVRAFSAHVEVKEFADAPNAVQDEFPVAGANCVLRVPQHVPGEDANNSEILVRSDVRQEPRARGSWGESLLFRYEFRLLLVD